MTDIPIEEQIRVARQKRGWKAVELARRAGVTPSALSALEGGYGASRPVLEAVCRVLKIEVQND